VQRRAFSLAREIHVLVSHDVTVQPPANKKAVLDKYGSSNQQRGRLNTPWKYRELQILELKAVVCGLQIARAPVGLGTLKAADV